MKLKHIAVAAALMTSGSAFAGATGNVAVFSDYLYRGITQTGSDAAVQGGLDYAHASGAYAGTWISSLTGGAGYETDLYAGFAGKAGDVGYDVGYIFYGYRDGTKANFSEIYAGLTVGSWAAKVYYSPEFYTSEEAAFYVTTSYGFALSDTLTLTPQIGYSFGDGIEEAVFGGGAFGGVGVPDSYLDYSLTLAKTLEGGYTFSFAVAANSEDSASGTFGGLNKERVFVGLKKSFDL
ncbi:MAG TPA: TorF family putative porin [Solimonas sp.]